MSQNWRISPLAAEKASVCIRAAEMRARAASWSDIAKELGLSSLHEARKCAEVGYGLAPGEDLRMARRRAADEIDQLRRELWAVVDNPPPMTTVTGKLVEVTGEDGNRCVLPDQAIKVMAVKGLAELNKEYRKLYGTDAPRQSVSVIASVPLEELQAERDRLAAEINEAKALPGQVISDGENGPQALPAG